MVLVLLDDFSLVQHSNIVDVVAHRQHQVEFRARLDLGAFEDFVLGDLVRQALEQLELFMVVDQQGKPAVFLLEGDAFGRWKRTTDREKLLGQHLASLELVRYHNWNLIKVFHHGCGLRGEATQHHSLNGAPSGDAVLGI